MFKGTYVRALGRDLAMALGAKGHLVQLRRLKVGAFDEKAAISLDIGTKSCGKIFAGYSYACGFGVGWGG